MRVLLEQIDEVLGVAQIGEIGHRGDDDLVGLQQHALDPWRPRVRQIHGDERNVLAHDIEHDVAGIGRDVVVAVEHNRGRKDAQVLGAFGEQAVEQHLIEALRALQGLGDPLHGS